MRSNTSPGTVDETRAGGARGFLGSDIGLPLWSGPNSGVGVMSQGATHSLRSAGVPPALCRAGRPHSAGALLEAPCIVAIGPAAVIGRAASAKEGFFAGFPG